MATSPLSTTFRASENINPTYYKVWHTQKPYIILKGGRNSFKSSVIALLLVFKMAQAVNQGKQVEIIVIRKVANTLYDSVYQQIKWAIDKYGLGNKFEYRKSPYKIIHKGTNSTFHFYGQDDYEKLK